MSKAYVSFENRLFQGFVVPPEIRDEFLQLIQDHNLPPNLPRLRFLVLLLSTTQSGYALSFFKTTPEVLAAYARADVEMNPFLQIIVKEMSGVLKFGHPAYHGGYEKALEEIRGFELEDRYFVFLAVDKWYLSGVTDRKLRALLPLISFLNDETMINCKNDGHQSRVGPQQQQLLAYLINSCSLLLNVDYHWLLRQVLRMGVELGLYGGMFTPHFVEDEYSFEVLSDSYNTAWNRKITPPLNSEDKWEAGMVGIKYQYEAYVLELYDASRQRFNPEYQLSIKICSLAVYYYKLVTQLHDADEYLPLRLSPHPFSPFFTPYELSPELAEEIDDLLRSQDEQDQA